MSECSESRIWHYLGYYSFENVEFIKDVFLNVNAF